MAKGGVSRLGNHAAQQSRTHQLAATAPHKTGNRLAPSKLAAATVSQLAELQAENALLRADGEALRAQQKEWVESRDEMQRMLTRAVERESDMATLLESCGTSALTHVPLDWSVPEAQAALQEDEEHQQRLDR